MNLTPSQQSAIRHGGNSLQLIACAGSGKTGVVARRVVHLLDPAKAKSLVPANIIAFTFTDKAAAELKERIVTRTREALGEINGLAEMFVGTIHAFALDLIKNEIPEYLKYEVLNEIQQGLFVDRYSKQSGLTASTDLKGQPLRRYTDTRHFISALAILREADLDLDSAKLAGCSVFGGLDTYRNLLEQRSYLDYSSFGIQNDGKSLHHRYHSNSSRMVNTSNWRLRAKKIFTLSSNAVMRVSAQHPKASPSSSSVSEIIARNRCHSRPAKLNAFNRSCISARTSPMRALSHSNFA